MDNALMGTPPIAAQIGLVLVMPNQPAAMLEILVSRVFQIRQDFRKAAHIQGIGRLQHPRNLADPLDRPRDSVFLALETIPIDFLDIVERVGKHQINTSIVQRSQPIYPMP